MLTMNCLFGLRLHLASAQSDAGQSFPLAHPWCKGGCASTTGWRARATGASAAAASGALPLPIWASDDRLLRSMRVIGSIALSWRLLTGAKVAQRYMIVRFWVALPHWRSSWCILESRLRLQLTGRFLGQLPIWTKLTRRGGACFDCGSALA